MRVPGNSGRVKVLVTFVLLLFLFLNLLYSHQNLCHIVKYDWIFLQALREEVEEKFNDGYFTWDDRRPHDCAALLKQFLRLGFLVVEMLVF